MSNNWDKLLDHDQCELSINGIDIIVERGVFLPDPKLTYSTGIIIDNLPKLNGLRVADIGTGSGILAIIAAIHGAREVIATDNSNTTIDNALVNVRRNNVTEKVQLIKTDLFKDVGGKFDVIFANLPILDTLWNANTGNILKTFLVEAGDKIAGAGKIYIPWGSFAEKNKMYLEQSISDTGYDFTIITENRLGYNWYLYILSRSSRVDVVN